MNKSPLKSTPEGDNVQEIVEWIKTMQVRGMKFPPKKIIIMLISGYFSFYYKRYKPGVALQLADCEFLGLVGDASYRYGSNSSR